MNETITKQIETICEEMCDKYCKYPEAIRSEYKDIDQADEELLKICDDCPLMRF